MTRAACGLQVLASHEVTVYSDGSESTFRAMFPEPLEVEPAVQYIASVTLKVSCAGRRSAGVHPDNQSAVRTQTS